MKLVAPSRPDWKELPVKLVAPSPSDGFWPERGPMTNFCYLLGTFDLILIAFLVYQVVFR